MNSNQATGLGSVSTSPSAVLFAAFFASAQVSNLVFFAHLVAVFVLVPVPAPVVPASLVSASVPDPGSIPVGAVPFVAAPAFCFDPVSDPIVDVHFVVAFVSVPALIPVYAAPVGAVFVASLAHAPASFVFLAEFCASLLVAALVSAALLRVAHIRLAVSVP